MNPAPGWWKRYGLYRTPHRRPPTIHSVLTYSGLHQRLRSQRGPAKDLNCECGEPARQWAYLGGCPQEIRESGGKRRVYSLDLNRYAPLCVSCHVLLDMNPMPPADVTRDDLLAHPKWARSLAKALGVSIHECTIVGCTQEVVGRGWCRKHYSRWHRHGDPLAPPPPRKGRVYKKRTPSTCQEPECERPFYCKNRCRSHYDVHYKASRLLGQADAT